MHGSVVLTIGLETALRRDVHRVLSSEGVRVLYATSAGEALQRVSAIPPHLILVAGSALEDGCSLCRQLRDRVAAPILLIGGMEPSPNLEQALQHGADDFLLQPIRTSELLMRARLLMQRPIASRRPAHRLPVYTDDQLVLDLDARRVSVCGRPVHLTPREFALLTCLYRNAGQILSMAQILEDVWGWEFRNNPEYVHTYISRLRRKLEPDPSRPTYLLSDFGAGYRFERQRVRGAPSE